MKHRIRITVSLVMMLALIVSLAAVSASAANYTTTSFADNGQKHFSVAKTKTAPKADGRISAGEYGNVISTMNYGNADTSGGSGPDNDADDDTKTCITDAQFREVVTRDAKLYLTYDNNYIYVGITATDPQHWTPVRSDEDPGEVWDGDYVEFDISTMTSDFNKVGDRVRFAIGKSNSGNMCAYFAKLPSSAQAKHELNKPIASTKNSDIYYNKFNVNISGTSAVYEFALSWKEIFGLNHAPDSCFFYYQFGIGDERYADKSNYDAYLGVLRYSVKLPETIVSDLASSGIIFKTAYHYLNFTKSAADKKEEATLDANASSTVSKITSTLPESSSAVSKITLPDGNSSNLQSGDTSSAQISDVTGSDDTAVVSGESSLISQAASGEEEKGGFPTWGWIAVGVVGAAIVAAGVILLLKKKSGASPDGK